MKDSRPLSERFELPYVRKKHFADRWTGRLGFVAAAATVVTVGAFQLKGDDRPYTAGELTKAHDMFASDCMKCHDASNEKGLRGYLMPATDDKCLKCHENQAGLHASNQIDLFTMSMPGHPEVRMSGNCAACHMEHQGRQHDLRAVSDQTCVRCHADLANQGMKMVQASATKPVEVTPAPASAAESAPEPAKPVEGGAK
jgi:predicted CXXCH cytochrome family protein